MLSSITSYAEFQRRLAAAVQAMDALVSKYPGDSQLASIKAQLEALTAWTSGGQKPSQDQKDSLNFGLLASRYVDDLDSDLGGELAALSSFVVYW